MYDSTFPYPNYPRIAANDPVASIMDRVQHTIFREAVSGT